MEFETQTMVDIKDISGKDVLFVRRERYFAIIAEHEIILFPHDELPVQIKKFNDSVKATTLEKEWSNVKLYREIDKSIFPEYLEKRGYSKDFITSIWKLKD